MDFSSTFQVLFGGLFLAPRLEILYTSQVNIYLEIYFEIFSHSPINSLSELGGHNCPPSFISLTILPLNPRGGGGVDSTPPQENGSRAKNT